MIKKHFQKEIEISGTQSRTGTNVSKEVSKIQSWLNLDAFSHPNVGIATDIDGDFGPATEKAVKNYQTVKGYIANGIVTKGLFEEMSNVMKVAFTQSLSGSGLRELVVNAAKLHLNAAARELVIKGQSNSGSWVRAYMDGNEGKDWLWCMGFVQAVLDQATSQIGQQFTDIVKRSFSCDTVGIYAKQKNNFISYSSVRSNPSLVKPGDIFLLQSNKNSSDWIHTGLVISVSNEVFETIEGNTNADGSENGYGVLRRSRNFMKSKLDIIKIA